MTAKRRRLSISFSGGKTSAFMADHCLNGREEDWDDVVVVFANTGQEHEKTLEYVNACDKQYGLNVVWLEAVVDPESGQGTKHRVVTFETASRKGEPFEGVATKFGLPNQTFQVCNREMKLRPMTSYLRSLGWKRGDHQIAVGIRYDELDRMSPASMADGVFYPLIDAKVTKEQVLSWEASQPVRLGIPEHYGNCVWCWKKSFRKLATVAREMPRAFEFPAYLEARYPNNGAGQGNRRMFRGRKSVRDIFDLARDPNLKPFVDSFKYSDDEVDLGAACGESCEIGTDGAEETLPEII